MAFGIKKYDFVDETPLYKLERLSADLGVNFYIKRDDLTSLGAGGNKLRKLEYLMKDAVDKGSTMILTVGGAQTNHGRLTAAVAAKLGLKCAILAIDDYPGELSANMLLDRIMGCELILCHDDGTDEDEQIDKAKDKIIKILENKGENVYYIPVGGSNVLGALGYFDAAIEIDRQAKELGIQNATVYDSVGSIGTYMGLYCGLQYADSPLKLTGVAISPFGSSKEKRIVEYFNEVKESYNLKFTAKREDFHIETGYTRGGYNNPSKEVRDAIYYMARTEGILLDPCYTGKGFAGILDMMKDGKISKGETIIFIHTGGFPGLYTPHHRVEFEKELIDEVYTFDSIEDLKNI
ncbi:MAG: D-cysteine desulfhydrase family protein [Clostridiales bacterium]|nr:D-cysteine desulfhydrase family protein [Clostridiales bacterium]MDD7347851.1 D-cysteine desulfhydrase family protein [Clostridiales bacterium]MDY4060865.1 D-cysteine desulfhydrase family protein [Anaerovoracaceae bacterium]